MGMMAKRHKQEKLDVIMKQMRDATAVKQATDKKHIDAMAKQKLSNAVHDTKVVKEGLAKATSEDLAKAAIEKIRNRGEAER